MSLDVFCQSDYNLIYVDLCKSLFYGGHQLWRNFCMYLKSETMILGDIPCFQSVRYMSTSETPCYMVATHRSRSSRVLERERWQPRILHQNSIGVILRRNLHEGDPLLSYSSPLLRQADNETITFFIIVTFIYLCFMSEKYEWYNWKGCPLT